MRNVLHQLLCRIAMCFVSGIVIFKLGIIWKDLMPADWNNRNLDLIFHDCPLHKLTELTEMSWYEWFIIAMRRLRRTMMLMMEKVPNMMRPQNLVNSLIPESSKLSRSINPKAAQNKVCVVSHKLKNTCFSKKKAGRIKILTWQTSYRQDNGLFRSQSGHFFQKQPKTNDGIRVGVKKT